MKKLILLLLLLLSIFFVSCENKEWKYKTTETEVIIIKKYTEPQSINNRGAFEINRYFLYNNGEIHEVDLNDYMTFEIGDTIIISQTVRVK